MSVENPMVLGDDGLPFDDFYIECHHCGEVCAPTEMDSELDDVCTNCVADVTKTAKDELEQALTPSDYKLFLRILNKYSDGAL